MKEMKKYIRIIMFREQIFFCEERINTRYIDASKLQLRDWFFTIILNVFSGLNYIFFSELETMAVLNKARAEVGCGKMESMAQEL